MWVISTLSNLLRKHFNACTPNERDDSKHVLSSSNPTNFIRRASRRSTVSDGHGVVLSTGPGGLSSMRAAAPVSWSGTPIDISLCVMTDSELTESAVKLNRYILGFMGDRKTKKSQQDLVKSILEECLKKKKGKRTKRTKRTRRTRRTKKRKQRKRNRWWRRRAFRALAYLFSHRCRAAPR